MNYQRIDNFLKFIRIMLLLAMIILFEFEIVGVVTILILSMIFFGICLLIVYTSDKATTERFNALMLNCKMIADRAYKAYKAENYGFCTKILDEMPDDHITSTAYKFYMLGKISEKMKKNGDTGFSEIELFGKTLFKENEKNNGN